MNKQNGAAQLRYLEEASICLRRAGFETMPLEDQHLPIKWDGNHLCRVSGNGSILYREADIKRANVQDALQGVTAVVKTISEYMAIMERVPQLKADGLSGDYRILADFGNAVLAGHPMEHGVQFVTWDWDLDRMGVHQGHYFK